MSQMFEGSSILKIEALRIAGKRRLIVSVCAGRLARLVSEGSLVKRLRKLQAIADCF